MILVAGGDSFVFGSELKDQINGPSQSTFSAILARQHKLNYDCTAMSGNANGAISRMTMTTCAKYLEQEIPFGALVTWTFTNRYEFRFNYHTGHKISPWHSVNPWSTIDSIVDIEKEFKTKNVCNYDQHFEQHAKNLLTARTTGTAEFAKTWFKHVGDNEYFELFSSFKEMVFLQNFFTANQIPYIFLAADNHFFQHPNYIRQRDQYLETLYNQIDWSKWFFFELGTKYNETKQPRGFYQWAVENKYPTGTTHPLEEAHEAAAKLIKDKFNELVKKPLEQIKTRNQIQTQIEGTS